MCYLTQVYSNPILTLLKVKRGKRNQKSQIFPNHMKYRKHLCTVGKAWPRSSKRSFNSDSIRAIHEHNSLQYCASSWCLYECFSNLRDWHTLIAANRQFTDLTFAPLLMLITKQTRSSAIAEGLCDASCQLTRFLSIATQQCRNYLYKSWTNQSYEVGGLQWGNV